MEITDAVMLGFNRHRHYFEGEVFAKGDVLTLTIEGLVKDLDNKKDELSSTVTAGLEEIFDSSITGSLSNYNWRTRSHEIGDIKINGIEFGKGKILSIESSTSPDMRESKIQLSKYLITIEFFLSLGSANFSIQGPAMGPGVPSTNWYNQVEDTLKPWAHRLETFQETFDFTTRGGEQDYTHSISIKVRDEGDTKATEYFTEGGAPSSTRACLPGTNIPATPINIAGYIAWKLFNESKPSFPLHLEATFDLSDGSGLEMAAPHDAFYTEAVNQISGECKYTKKWKKHLFGSQPESCSDLGALGTTQSTDQNNPPDNPHDLYRFEIIDFDGDKAEYTAKYTYALSKNNTGITVTERADILKVGYIKRAVDGNRKIMSEPQKPFEKAMEGSIQRCQCVADAIFKDNTPAGVVNDGSASAKNNKSLRNINLDTKVFETPQENRFGYEMSFSSDPALLDVYKGFKIERKLSVQRSPDGVNTFTQESTAIPLKQAVMSSQSTWNSPGFHHGAGEPAGINKSTTTDPYGLTKDAADSQREEVWKNHHGGKNKKGIENILDLIRGWHLPAINYEYFVNSVEQFTDYQGAVAGPNVRADAGWAKYFVAAGIVDSTKTIKLIKSDVKIDPIVTSHQAEGDLDPVFGDYMRMLTYRITATDTWTDDKVVQNQWHINNPVTNKDKSWFTRKQVSIQNTVPTRKKESYMVAGHGEVLHASIQSNIGTFAINFQGPVVRDMEHNPLTNGAVLEEKDWEKLIVEARDDCVAYFSSMLNPTLVFITDTTFSFGSDREFNLTVTLSYTRNSDLTRLEPRI